jgi:2-polyprenyl-6-methoxyphenol hydroxylase-like FAD-dependent oxidoreductase
MTNVSMQPLKVLIVGAGTGGLCLGHGLQASGIDVRIFERDLESTDRIQGYRLNISATGNRALNACLPPENYGRFVDASAKSSTRVSVFDHHLRRLLRIDTAEVDRVSVDSERPISRIALRKVLLDGVEHLIEFGRTFERYEESPDGQIIAYFEDGSAEHGTLLVGADGAGSRVARQLLPGTCRIDTGLVAISGRFALDEAFRHEIPDAVLRGPTLIMGPRGAFMFASSVEYPPEARPIYDSDEYVMWGVSARREDFGLNGPPDQLDPEAARGLVLRKINGWAPALRQLVERADPAFITAFSVKTAREVKPWRTRRVTLVGDALHNMAPFRGMGANAALYDAAALRTTLADIAKGQRSLLAALAGYERDMIKNGFAAVRSSLTDMSRLHSRSMFQRLVTRLIFRLVDIARPLQRAYRGTR